MTAIVQTIRVEVDTATGNAKLREAQRELDGVGAAGKRADAGIRAAEAGSKSLGQTFSMVTAGVGKFTFGVTALSSILGLAAGGGLTGAVGGALTALKGLHDIMTGAADRAKRLEDRVRLQAAAMAHAAEVADRYGAAVANAVGAKAARMGTTPGSLTYEELRAAGAEGIGGLSADIGRQAAFADVEQKRGILERLQSSQTIGASAVARESLRVAVEEARRDFEAAKKAYDKLALMDLPVIDTKPKGGGGSRSGGNFYDPRRDLGTLVGTLGDIAGPYADAVRRQYAAAEAQRAGAAAMHAASGAGYMAEREAMQGRDYARMNAQADERSANAAGGFMNMGAAGGMFKELATQAVDGASMIVGATSEISGAIGQMWTNLILSGADGAKGFQKHIGNILAGISAQAFGYATLLGGMAIASALVPFAGLPAAASLGTAAAVMAGTGAALALTAKGLGASASGGFSGKGGGGGGGGGGGSDNFRSRANQAAGGPTNVTVIVGISRGQVHDAVVDESNGRQSSRRPRVLVAT